MQAKAIITHQMNVRIGEKFTFKSSLSNPMNSFCSDFVDVLFYLIFLKKRGGLDADGLPGRAEPEGAKEVEGEEVGEAVGEGRAVLVLGL